jgi:cytochrome bd-type quinol oxidase subunit 2
MLRPLLHLVVTQPHLLGEHVEAYAQLVGEEVGKVSALWIWRVACWAVAGVMALMGVFFIGIALMLWGAASPDDRMVAWWLLIVVPAVPFVIAAICMLLARSKADYPAFEIVKKQLDADVALLREASA